MCFTNRHDMTLAVKVALNPQYKQPVYLDLEFVSMYVHVSLFPQDCNKKVIILESVKYTQYQILKSLPNDKIFDCSKLLAFAEAKINVTEKLKLILGRAENIVGKGENVGNQHFLLFPQCFLKCSSVGSLRLGIVWTSLHVKCISSVSI